MKSNARDGERGSSCRSGETPGRSADKGCCDYATLLHRGTCILPVILPV